MTAGGTMAGMVRTVLTGLALGALLAACTHNTPASTTATTPPATTPGNATSTTAGTRPGTSPAPSQTVSYRPAVIGEPFPIDGWTVTVTGQRCGKTADLVTGGTDAGVVESDYVCVIDVTGVNTGTGPAALVQGSDSAPGPLNAAGFDGRGQQFTASSWAQSPVNPGVTANQQLMFGVPADVRLSRLGVGNVLVTLR